MLNMPNLIREWKKVSIDHGLRRAPSGYANADYRLASGTGPSSPGRRYRDRGFGSGYCTSCNTSVLLSQYRSNSRPPLCFPCFILPCCCALSSREAPFRPSETSGVKLGHGHLPYMPSISQPRGLFIVAAYKAL